ncbi:hypothetical protein ACP70R_011451 [Stipagrostis hirtigluma subsp. patula]
MHISSAQAVNVASIVVSVELPGLPAGVKFDPSDLELLEHLEGNSNLPNSKPHALINEFIPTIEESEGICYTHPENLPGVKMDGSSHHFFHKISNAYTSGQRKRRKINNSDHAVCDENIRWHKTGKSRPVCDDNGVQKGWKKILTLYTGPRRGGIKMDKTGWVMHQYHLGVDESENDGELVVSKVFYQPSSKKIDKSEMDVSVAECDALGNSGMDASVSGYDVSAVKIDPRTPKTDPPQPHRPNNSPCETEQYTPVLQDQREEEFGASVSGVKDEAIEYTSWYAGSSQAVEDVALANSEEPVQPTCTEQPQPSDCSNMDAFLGLLDLDDTLPCHRTPSDFGTLADLQFGSQDSLGSWPFIFD